MSTTLPKIRDILLLLSVPNIGTGRVRRILSIFETGEAVFRAPLKRLMQIDGVDEKIARQLKAGPDEQWVDTQLRLMAQKQIDCLTIWEGRYPDLLKKTAVPPVLLFYRGQIPDKWPPTVGIVGTRRPTAYGRAVTEKLATELVEQGIAVVSGLARGIDTVAHTAALKRGGQTYAVLGCGVDYIYPPENRPLFESMLSNGAILSEYPVGTRPDAVNFPRRNRIISGMSLGILVVEAGSKSGALITANFALEQNREVFAVPGSITNSRSDGPNRLIQQGAKLVMSVDDILEELSSKLQQRKILEKPLPPNLSEPEKILLTHLSTEPRHIDQLVMDLDESPASLLGRLLNLELLGLVKQLSGKMFIRM